MNNKDTIKLLIESNLFNDAKIAIQQLENILPDDIELLTMKAVILISENRLEAAEDILQVGLEKAPTSFDILFNLAYIYQIQQKLNLALWYYERALMNVEDIKLRVHVEKITSSLKGNIDRNISLKLVSNTVRPVVSIVVLAYNHLDFTKLCIESILKYTSHINYELITVNNGSTDGTQEYFESLPKAKIVNLQKNVGPVNGFNIGMQLAEGRYTACVCNDFIFTKNWMDNLLTCIGSDEKIGFVSPGANYISNAQMISGNFTNFEEMQQFAEIYNTSDPSKWEERVRLLPCVLMVRTKILNEIGYYDPIYYFGEFADDDIAFRIRRAGYKLVFAGDTFTYHAGSITTGIDQKENNSLTISKDIFYDKFGIDSWEDTMFSINLVDAPSIISKSYQISILGINAKCGGTPLQLKNKLIASGKSDIKVTNFTQDPKYLVDLKTVSEQAVCGRINNLSDYFKGEKYDFILLEDGLESIPDLNNALNHFKYLLKPDGQLVFKIMNGSHYSYLVNLMFGNVVCHEGEHSSTFFDIKSLSSFLLESGFHITKQIRVTNVPEVDVVLVNKLLNIFPEQAFEMNNVLSTAEHIFVLTLKQ
jgi:GT2 family glycosyltransferase